MKDIPEEVKQAFKAQSETAVEVFKQQLRDNGYGVNEEASQQLVDAMIHFLTVQEHNEAWKRGVIVLDPVKERKKRNKPTRRIRRRGAPKPNAKILSFPEAE